MVVHPELRVVHLMGMLCSGWWQKLPKGWKNFSSRNWRKICKLFQITSTSTWFNVLTHLGWCRKNKLIKLHCFTRYSNLFWFVFDPLDFIRKNDAQSNFSLSSTNLVLKFSTQILELQKVRKFSLKGLQDDSFKFKPSENNNTTITIIQIIGIISRKCSK